MDPTDETLETSTLEESADTTFCSQDYLNREYANVPTLVAYENTWVFLCEHVGVLASIQSGLAG